MHKNQEAGSERGREMIEIETSQREKVKGVEKKKKKKKREEINRIQSITYNCRGILEGKSIKDIDLDY